MRAVLTTCSRTTSSHLCPRVTITTYEVASTSILSRARPKSSTTMASASGNRSRLAYSGLSSTTVTLKCTDCCVSADGDRQVPRTEEDQRRRWSHALHKHVHTAARTASASVLAPPLPIRAAASGAGSETPGLPPHPARIAQEGLDRRSIRGEDRDQQASVVLSRPAERSLNSGRAVLSKVSIRNSTDPPQIPFSSSGV